MRERVAVIGAPSSAGAYSPGQEKAPAALREAGLIERLGQAGLTCFDLGDVPGFRWHPDPQRPRAQNLEAAVAAARAVAEAVAGEAANAFTLVLGGDCTVGIGTVAGQLGSTDRLGLIYFDQHADMNVPSSVVDGALDWMGLAHMLALAGTAPELAGIGPRQPLLGDDQVVLFGVEMGRVTAWEREEIEERSLQVIDLEDVEADPRATATRARAALEGSCERLAIHFDVDVLDFLDAPLAENVDRNGGLRLEAAIEALTIVLDSPKAGALTVTEVNPDHGDPEGATLRALADGLAAALAPRKRA
jgi:arginase